MTATIRRLVWLGTFLLCLVCERAFAQNPDPKIIEGAKKEGQMVFYTTMTLDQSKEVVDRFQKISVHQADIVSHRRRAAANMRKAVEPDPPRLFRGYKRVVENPEDYKDFEGLVKLYNSIFKLR
jgi:hypothetical protein